MLITCILCCLLTQWCEFWFWKQAKCWQGVPLQPIEQWRTPHQVYCEFHCLLGTRFPGVKLCRHRQHPADWWYLWFRRCQDEVPPFSHAVWPRFLTLSELQFLPSRCGVMILPTPLISWCRWNEMVTESLACCPAQSNTHYMEMYMVFVTVLRDVCLHVLLLSSSRPSKREGEVLLFPPSTWRNANWASHTGRRQWRRPGPTRA